ncbi:hypothetical protein [Methanoregula sp.]|uniref:hypothetical protein n=1 Tax=Methanoregula sp. TaxID=2052170 RepID=UPI000CB40ED4|nr:hypothetical protein [Methanoregula sp.]PKG33981.1 MAG: hypothetical protein CW742_00295 [Methanoregula sp.]
MQLPRGTFREIRKKIVLQDLLSEFEDTRFTGTCGIVAGPATGSFVFQNGACILARFHGQAGDAAIREMQQSARDAVDVIISTLDETQVRLALEFNPACIVLTEPSPDTGHSPPARGTAPTRTIPPVSPDAPVAPASPRRGRRILIASGVPVTKQDGGQMQDAPRAPIFPSAIPPETKTPVADTNGEPEDLEREIDALDSMDLNLVTSRIRSECRTLVKHLDLDHLLER